MVAKKKGIGKKSPDDVIFARRQRLYLQQTTGAPARALVLAHAAREGVSVETGWRDWKQVKIWNEEDWALDRESVIARIQTIRFRAIEKAFKQGQMNSVQQLLADMGKVVGESVETINIQAPQLSIAIEDKHS